jgi:hypothetical protein
MRNKNTVACNVQTHENSWHELLVVIIPCRRHIHIECLTKDGKTTLVNKTLRDISVTRFADRQLAAAFGEVTSPLPRDVQPSYVMKWT